jgi:hypothetical protein
VRDVAAVVVGRDALAHLYELARADRRADPTEGVEAMNEQQQAAYDAGKAQQAAIFAAKPDFTREQWLAAGDALRRDMDAKLVEVERLRGRLDAIGLQIAYARLPR